MEHRAVAAHGHQQVGATGQLRLRHASDRQQAEIDLDGVDRQYVAAALEQVRGETQHGLADPRIGCAPGQGDRGVDSVAGAHDPASFSTLALRQASGQSSANTPIHRA
jgi:hypothetical protein